MIEIIPNLHPLAVHFPIALTAASLLFHLGALLFAPRRWALQWAVAGHWTLWLAAVAALVTAALGWQAFNSVAHDEAGHVAMLAHRAWALPTVGALALLAAWDAWRHPAERVNPWWFVVLLAGLAAAVGVTAWHGGELVYRHGLGVISLPQVAALPAPAPSERDARTVHRHSDGHLHSH